ncbi:syntaxin-41-like [Iris pallida]|uniref:Syntaxin-41-like n=1 Tax=Iris pallida TaxID=29817 RepID=A0AAX6F897_IRIPA|nr:syntaxin-41-like [Iris pallida]
MCENAKKSASTLKHIPMDARIRSSLCCSDTDTTRHILNMLTQIRRLIWCVPLFLGAHGVPNAQCCTDVTCILGVYVLPREHRIELGVDINELGSDRTRCRHK